MDPGAVRKVAIVAFFGRDGDDLAAELECRARTGRRDARLTHVLRSFDESRARLEEVRCYADREAAFCANRRIEEMQISSALEDDFPTARGCGDDREIGVT